MSMKQWAENEVALAKANEPESDECLTAYANACYDSALKAYNSLLEDGHSGMSMSITIGILKRLLDSYPLTPIEDLPEVWDLVHETDEVTKYQCRRSYSLFKGVDKRTGESTFHDTDRVVCVSAENSSCRYHNGFLSKLIDDMYPITMPYYPIGRYELTVKESLYDKANGDFDTIAITEIKFPNGIVDTDPGLFFKEVNSKFVKCDYDEYQQRIQEGEIV